MSQMSCTAWRVRADPLALARALAGPAAQILHEATLDAVAGLVATSRVPGLPGVIDPSALGLIAGSSLPRFWRSWQVGELAGDLVCRAAADELTGTPAGAIVPMPVCRIAFVADPTRTSDSYALVWSGDPRFLEAWSASGGVARVEDVAGSTIRALFGVDDPPGPTVKEIRALFGVDDASGPTEARAEALLWRRLFGVDDPTTLPASAQVAGSVSWSVWADSRLISWSTLVDDLAIRLAGRDGGTSADWAAHLAARARAGDDE